MSAMQTMSVKEGEAVPLKFALMRCGKLMQTRRVTLLRPTLANVTDLLQGWVNGSFAVQYMDEDEDTVQVGSEAEWTECLRLWREGSIAGPNALHLSCVVGRCRATSPVQRARAAESERSQPLRVESRSYVRHADGTVESGPDEMQERSLGGAAGQVLERLLGPGAMGRISAGGIGVEALSRLGWVEVKQGGAEGVELDFDIGQLAHDVNRRAHDAFDKGDFGVAADWWQLLSDLTPGSSNPLYNLACARSQEGQTARALEALSMAIALGYKNLQHMETDADLERVRTERPGEWKALREQVQGNPQAEEPEVAPEAAKVPAAGGEEKDETQEEEKEGPAADAQPQDLRRVMYSEQLAVLREMGVAEDVALEILDGFGGNLERTVQELFSQ